MTKPHQFDKDRAEGSQVLGIASSPGYAWNVNFNNGNTDINHHNNEARVRAVRSVSAPASQ